MRTISMTALRRLVIGAQGVRRTAALDEAFARALDRLRRTVGLERVVRP